ncbi:MAG: TolC family protein [Burkholderiales bacterium]|nr:TolC family protein [Burkholderiales bacterium]
MQKRMLPCVFTALIIPSLICTLTSSTVHAQTLSGRSTQLEIDNTTIAPQVENTLAKVINDQRLSLADALQLAKKFHPELAAAQQEIKANEGSLRQAGLLRNPEVSTIVEGLRSETKTTTWQLNQAIELGGKRSARIVLAERGLLAAKNDLAIMLAEVKSAVAIGFYDILIAQERERLANSSLALTQRAFEAVKKQVSLGKVPPLEETKARIAQASVQLELTQALSDIAIARQRLFAMTGLKEHVQLQLIGQFDLMPNVPEKQDLERRLRLSPHFIKAQIEVEKRLAIADSERAKQVPDITLSVGTKREQLGGRQSGQHQTIVGVSLPLSLFDRNQGNLQESISRVDKAKDELAATEIRLRNELSQAHLRLSLAHTEASLMKNDVLPNAQHAFELAIKGFEFGKFNFLDVLDAQRSLLAAKTQYLRSCTEVHRAASDIQALVGDTTDQPISLYPTTSIFQDK